MMLNGPKNGLTYTQNDREKWRNTFTMIVSASLHVLVTEKVQQASTITLAPRCSTHRTLPDQLCGISLQSLYSLQLAPQMSQNWWRLPPYTTCSMRPEGAPLGKRQSPVPRGAALCRCPGGKPPCNFGRLVGPYCP